MVLIPCRHACIYMDISLEPRERHRMFSERMTFWHTILYRCKAAISYPRPSRDLLEQYAVDNAEEQMLVEIESAIDGEDDGDDEEEEVGGEIEVANPLRRKNKMKKFWNRRRQMRQKRMKGPRGRRWHKMSKKQRNMAKLEARKNRRLAKKLRGMME